MKKKLTKKQKAELKEQKWIKAWANYGKKAKKS